MRWKDCIGTYRSYISLGSTCQTAYQLKRLGLRQFAGPLDWFMSPSTPDLSRLIRSRFNGFMAFDQLQLQGSTADCYIVKDNAYAVVSYHDFSNYVPVELWAEAYPPFKEKINRRIEYFMKTVKNTSNSPICFIRVQASKTEAVQLKAALNTLVRGKFRLLIVNHHLDHSQEITHEDWGLAGIGSVTVPVGNDWRGSNQAWDNIMNGFRVKAVRQ
ncbi:DUF1796 family putative cysteine peptidase [Paenibacillus abyssi]|uniref:Peptidase n=1 Tax=Paenibacillus abyssi TaxID=1340531 RepID=A0A917FUH8_9BACL|nr:DUF1796 family putative cysteine peptidase [Paenibacillus abyssi]GGG03733.1 hypothetical protein GCM10010916_21030 [Paenibacillus abyssi]